MGVNGRWGKGSGIGGRVSGVGRRRTVAGSQGKGDGGRGLLGTPKDGWLTPV